MNEHLSDAVSDLFPYDLPDWVVMRTHRNNYGFEAAHLKPPFSSLEKGQKARNGLIRPFLVF